MRIALCGLPVSANDVRAYVWRAGQTATSANLPEGLADA